MLVTQKRPRVLKWFHAGPLLFGDWGTSRLYVLGLAFYYTAHASALYLLAMSVIMAAVAWAYTVVCRCFPDGGGVYTAARQLSPSLAVVGATLLLCDYIVTAALSAIEGFHYFGAHRDFAATLAIVTIVGIGVINWLGARNAGRFALVVAVAAIIASAVIALLCIPLLPRGFQQITTGHESFSSPWQRWESLVRIVLALSGVEAVANMTGLMTHPVKRTARRTIWPVLAEVVILNMVFCLALSALPGMEDRRQPDYIRYELFMGLPSDEVPADVKEYRDTAMKVIAVHAGQRALGPEAGRILGLAASAVFALLLISAVNTAVMAKVSVMYSLSQDAELPRPLMRLNYSGVPWVALIIACALPIAILLFVTDVKILAELYAIGVVGAISINVLSCAANRRLDLRRWERIGMWTLGGFMSLVGCTIVVAKPWATLFAGTMLALVLGSRFVLARRAKAPAPLPEPATGWLAEVERAPAEITPGRARLMFAARGRYQAEYAVDMAQRRGAILFAIFVRTLRLIDIAPGAVPRVQDDPDALEALGTVAVLAHRRGVPFVPIYVCSPDIAEEILDYTVTFACDTLILGKSRRSLFARRVAGDVVAQVAKHLPNEVALITRDAAPYEAPQTEPRPGETAGAGENGNNGAPPT